MPKRTIRPTYRSIPYSLRPAKWVERKMMLDALSRLQSFGHLRDYAYFGFGSPFFTDFRLFHRAFGITRMVNIEQHEEDRARFEFNRPFTCIDLRFGPSNDILGDLDWSSRTICWLDYDKRLNAKMFDDVRTFVRKAQSGSALLVSVNALSLAKGLEKDDTAADKIKNLLTKSVGREHVPPGLTIGAVKDWGTAQLFHAILSDVVKEAVGLRNQTQQTPDQMKQVFHFRYEDGAPMITVGWVLVAEGEVPKFEHCKFGDFDFHKDGPEAFLINAPVLTLREMRELDSLFPWPTGKRFRRDWLPAGDAMAFSRIYRYYPSFASMEF